MIHPETGVHKSWGVREVSMSRLQPSVITQSRHSNDTFDDDSRTNLYIVRRKSTGLVDLFFI